MLFATLLALGVNAQAPSFNPCDFIDELKCNSYIDDGFGSYDKTGAELCSAECGGGGGFNPCDFIDELQCNSYIDDGFGNYNKTGAELCSVECGGGGGDLQCPTENDLQQMWNASPLTEADCKLLAAECADSVCKAQVTDGGGAVVIDIRDICQAECAHVWVHPNYFQNVTWSGTTGTCESDNFGCKVQALVAVKDVLGAENFNKLVSAHVEAEAGALQLAILDPESAHPNFNPLFRNIARILDEAGEDLMAGMMSDGPDAPPA